MIRQKKILRQPLGLQGLSLESCMPCLGMLAALDSVSCCDEAVDRYLHTQWQQLWKSTPAVAGPSRKCIHSLSSAPLAISFGLKIGTETKFTRRVLRRGCSHVLRSSLLIWMWTQDLISFLQDNKTSVLFSLSDNYYLFFPHCLSNLHPVFFWVAESLLAVIFLSWLFLCWAAYEMLISAAWP